MSRTLYAVRVRPSFRFWEKNNQVFRHHPEVAGLFATPTQAHRFAESHLPIEGNPFAVDWWNCSGGEVLQLSLYDPEYRGWSGHSERTHFTREDLFEKLIAIALIPPDEAEWEVPLTWQHWWERTTHHWEIEQREALRRYLELPPWRPNPFEAELISFEYGGELHLTDQHEVLLEELAALAKTLGAPLPESVPGMDWLLNWWFDKASVLPASAREQLWRLLCPYPWEIVEVPY